jgi:hypothetical protein
MARSFSKNSKYDQHPGDRSRKDIQRYAHHQDRQRTRAGIRKGSEALPVFRRTLDYVAH